MTPRPSAQIRADHPEAASDRPHPRAVRLARIAIEIDRATGQVGVAALLAHDFTTAELIEHMPAAQRIVGAANG